MRHVPRNPTAYTPPPDRPATPIQQAASATVARAIAREDATYLRERGECVAAGRCVHGHGSGEGCWFGDLVGSEVCS